MKCNLQITRSDPDNGNAARMAFAVSTSLVVNLLFLVAGGLLVQRHPQPASGSDSYISVTNLTIAANVHTPRLRTAQPRRLPTSTPEPREFTNPIQLAPPPVNNSVAPKKSATATATQSAKPSHGMRRRVLVAESNDLPESRSGVATEGGVTATEGEPQPGTGASTNAAPPTGAAGTAGIPPPASEPPAAPSSTASPTPTGPTSDAQTLYQKLPEIPRFLQETGYKTSVHVRVEVKPDGTFVPFLSTSSGNPDVDLLVLDALKHWKWKPALKNGEPIASTEPFRFDFEIN